MSIVKQNSWIAGEVNPNLIDAQSNEMYYNAATVIENAYISKSQVPKRFPSLEKTTGLRTGLSGTAEVFFASAHYAGRNYLIYIRQVGSTRVAGVYIVSVNATLIFSHEVTLSAGAVAYPIDYTVLDSRIVITFNEVAPMIFDFVDNTVSAATVFNFVNQPTIDFGVVDYSGYSFVIAAAAVSTTSLDIVGAGVESAITSAWVGGMFYSIGDNSSEYLGQGKIVSYGSVPGTVTLTLNVIHSFEASTVTGTRVVLQQPIFYKAEEMPKYVTSFASRLYFANTKSFPLGIFGSRINRINDFNVGKGLPAEAIVYILNDTTSTTILNITSHIGLFIFTDNDEHIIIPSISRGIAPDTFVAQKLSSWGSPILPHSSGIVANRNIYLAPIIAGNSLLFVNNTKNKIIRIDSASANSFSTAEITKGMDIAIAGIDAVGVLDNPNIDERLIVFSEESTPGELNCLTQNGELFARTRVQIVPTHLAQTEPAAVTITSINNKFTTVNDTVLLAGGKVWLEKTYNDPTVPAKYHVGLSEIQSTVSTTFTPSVDAYEIVNGKTEYMPANVLYTFIGISPFIFGYSMPLRIVSMPLHIANDDTWAYHSISGVYVSYYNSAKFSVNNTPIAEPTLDELLLPNAPFKTNRDRITTSTTSSDALNYITVYSNEPYNVEILSYGWAIKSTIMT